MGLFLLVLVRRRREVLSKGKPNPAPHQTQPRSLFPVARRIVVAGAEPVSVPGVCGSATVRRSGTKYPPRFRSRARLWRTLRRHTLQSLRMFAAFDWNEVLMKAQMGAVIGGIGGACAGLVAYLTHKSDAKKQSEWEARERARIHPQANTAKTKSPLPLFVTILLITFVSVFAINPSLIAPLFVDRDLKNPGDTNGDSKPSATISDFGRYREKGPIRVVQDRNTSSGVSVISDKDFVLLEQTDQIPCRVGETWGMRIRCSDVPTNRPYTVRKEMYHPPMKQPDGSVRTKNVSEYKLRPDASPDQFCGWYFLKDYENELVAGEVAVHGVSDAADVTLVGLG
jgi:hypothetical protein